MWMISDSWCMIHFSHGRTVNPIAGNDKPRLAVKSQVVWWRHMTSWRNLTVFWWGHQSIQWMTTLLLSDPDETLQFHHNGNADCFQPHVHKQFRDEYEWLQATDVQCISVMAEQWHRQPYCSEWRSGFCRILVKHCSSSMKGTQTQTSWQMICATLKICDEILDGWPLTRSECC